MEELINMFWNILRRLLNAPFKRNESNIYCMKEGIKEGFSFGDATLEIAFERTE